MTRSPIAFVAPRFALVIACVPAFDDRRWVRQTLDARCDEVRFGQISVTCHGDQVEVLHATTTSGLDWSFQGRVVWRSGDLARAQITSVTVSIADDMVMIEDEQCPTCDVQRGPVGVSRPERTRPELLRDIQARVRLPATSARATVAAWRQR